MRKAKAYILFYVERTGQADMDKIATDSTATNPPDVDAAAAAGVCSEVVPQDNAAAATAATEVMMDGAAPQTDVSDEEAQENAGVNTAGLNEADDASEEAAADGDTSEETGAALEAAAP